MAKVVTVANQKGGVGKTTTAINLATCMAMSGRRALLIDFDPQCNATSGLGVVPGKRHAMLGDVPLDVAAADSPTPQLQVLPGSPALAEADSVAGVGRERMARVQGILTELVQSEKYDILYLDCPPSLGQLTRIALSASGSVLIPIQCEYFAMEGLSQLISIVRSVRSAANPRLAIEGIVLTMFDPTLELTQEVADEVRSHFPDFVYDTAVPRDVHISEAPSHGISVIDYAPRSRGALAHIQLAMEVIDRE
jgi:chromosome partitioning protein